MAEPVSAPARKLRSDLDHRQSRLDRFTQLSGKAHAAIDVLDEAARQCSTAQNMEIMDAASRNKGLSLISHMETNKAGEAVDFDQARMADLSKALQQSTSGQDLVNGPSDMPDLVVDMRFDPGLDVLSVLNVFALGKSKESCQEAIDKIAPLSARLDDLKERAGTAHAAAMEDYDALRNPMRAQWIRQIPASLVSLLPRDHLNPTVLRTLSTQLLEFLPNHSIPVPDRTCVVR